MSTPELKAIVVGAGLGGLTAGLALRRAGVEVAMFERAASMRSIQVGIGMVVWPNGMKALETVGVTDGVEAIGHALESLDLYTAAGKSLNRWGLDEMGGRMGASSYALSRGELHAVLADAYLTEAEINLGA